MHLCSLLIIRLSTKSHYEGLRTFPPHPRPSPHTHNDSSRPKPNHPSQEVNSSKLFKRPSNYWCRRTFFSPTLSGGKCFVNTCWGTGGSPWKSRHAAWGQRDACTHVFPDTKPSVSHRRAVGHEWIRGTNQNGKLKKMWCIETRTCTHAVKDLNWGF